IEQNSISEANSAQVLFKDSLLALLSNYLITLTVLRGGEEKCVQPCLPDCMSPGQCGEHINCFNHCLCIFLAMYLCGSVLWLQSSSLT
uniref:Uncharacterized protein n=1 Tax=Strigops habroptila TaxID=2489341 RepID=A0A672TGE6_STRHB